MPLTLDGALAHQREGGSCSTPGCRRFATGHLVGSVGVGLEGRYAEYVGSLVHPDERTAPDRAGHRVEAKVRLGRIGYDHVAGYVETLMRRS